MTETQKKLHSLANKLSYKIENAYGVTECIDTTCYVVPIIEKAYEIGFKEGTESTKSTEMERKQTT